MYFTKREKVFTARRLGYLLASLLFLTLALAGLGVLLGWRALTPFASLAADIGLSSLGTVGLKILTVFAGWLGFTFMHAVISERSFVHSWPGNQEAVIGIRNTLAGRYENMERNKSREVLLYGDDKEEDLLSRRDKIKELRKFPWGLFLLFLNPLTSLVFLLEVARFIVFAGINKCSTFFDLLEGFSPTKFFVSFLFSLVLVPLKGVVGISNIPFWIWHWGYSMQEKKRKEEAVRLIQIERERLRISAAEAEMQREAKAEALEAQREAEVEALEAQREAIREEVILRAGLHCAAWGGSVDIMQSLLLGYGANSLKKDERGNTAIQILAKSHPSKFVRLCITYANDPASLLEQPHAETALSEVYKAHSARLSPGGDKTLFIRIRLDTRDIYLSLPLDVWSHSETCIQAVERRIQAYRAYVDAYNTLCEAVPLFGLAKLLVLPESSEAQNNYTFLILPRGFCAFHIIGQHSYMQEVRVKRRCISDLSFPREFCAFPGMDQHPHMQEKMTVQEIRVKRKYISESMRDIQGLASAIPNEVVVLMQDYVFDYDFFQEGRLGISALESKEEESDKDGAQPLLLPLYADAIKTVAQLQAIHSYLEKAPGNLEKQDYKGDTLLLWAVKNNHLPIVEMLLKAGAKTEVKDLGGYTSLHRAVKSGSAKMERVLLDHGANKYAITSDALTVDNLRTQRECAVFEDALQSQLKEIRTLVSEGYSLRSQMATLLTEIDKLPNACKSRAKIRAYILEGQKKIVAKRKELETRIWQIEGHLSALADAKRNYWILGVNVCLKCLERIFIDETKVYMEKARERVEVIALLYPDTMRKLENEIGRLAQEVYHLKTYMALDLEKADPLRMVRSQEMIARMEEASAHVQTAIRCMRAVKADFKELNAFVHVPTLQKAKADIAKMYVCIDEVKMCMQKIRDFIEANRAEEGILLYDLRQAYAASQKKAQAELSTERVENTVEEVQEEESYRQLVEELLGTWMEEESDPFVPSVTKNRQSVLTEGSAFTFIPPPSPKNMHSHAERMGLYISL